ncbi:MAG TPA: hypothetical protein VK191_13100 [Symbiobacteriaceae bacterium]|nr:hypothetical protein [Symbiobacteriaceae bacterium]
MDHECPRGCTGECCKEDGTYSCAAGQQQYFELGERFPECPVSGGSTNWTRVS